MPFFPPDVVDQVRQIDLLTYLQTYEPQELVHFSGHTYCTKTHDSLKISNGKWCWWSRGIGGTSALDYLIKVRGLSFSAPVPEAPKQLVLPKPNRYADYAVQYLEGRGIDDELIDFCVQTGRVYEADIFVKKLQRTLTNVVFVGHDKTGKARYVGLRGIGTDFKGDGVGSDKHYSFNIPAAQPSPVLHLFESAIDLLSYATMLKYAHRSWNAENLLSLAGIYQPKKNIEESSIPAALSRYLEEYPHIEKIVLRLDNDPPGRLAAKTLETILPKKYAVETMLRRNKPMKVYTVKRQDCKEFTQRAKTYGILFCPIPYKKGDDTIDILVDQEDAARVDHIVEKFHLASVDAASIKSDIERSRSEKTVAENAGEKAVPEQQRPEKSTDDLLLDELLDQPAAKEAAVPTNPEAAKTAKSRPSEPTSKPASRTAEGATKQPDRPSKPPRPSVREELKEIREQKKQEAAGPKREEANRSKPRQQKTTRHEQPPRKKKKAKER